MRSSLQFGSLHGLCSLWLDDNRLDAIPLCIFQLHNLVTLRLSGNSIREVPQGINSLQQLENLVWLCALVFADMSLCD